MYISEKSNGNHIILGDMHSRLSIECHFSNNEREFIKMGYYNGCDVILESDTIQKIKSFAKNITIQTADGVMANWDDKLNTLSVYSIDMIAWRDKNKTAKEPLPVDVIQLTNWRMHNTCSLFYDKYQVDIEANKLTYTVLFPDAELPVQLNYTSIIYGNHGAKYTFLNSGSKTIDIHILDKNSDYDTF
nr:toxin B [Escherichia coli]